MTITRTGGEALVHGLLAHGIDTIFGLPGIQTDHFYNAVYDVGDRMRLIHTRHEQGAAYMALGYALASGKTGVYVVVPGPGFLNATAALATAYAASAPLLCLTGQIHTDHIGREYGVLHETPDQLGVMRSLTKWARRVERPAEMLRLLATALSEMRSDRPRPVGLEVPMNALYGTADFDADPVPLAVRRPAVDSDAIEEAARILGKARNPLIFVGGGAIDASEQVRALAETLQAPVIASGSGRGILSSRHPFSYTYGAGRSLWEQADAVIAVGTRMTMPLMQWKRPANLTLIRVDIDPRELSRLRAPNLSLVADSRAALRALLPALARHNRHRPSRRDEMTALRERMDAVCDLVQPQMGFIRAIRDALPDDGIYVEELTQIGYASRVAMPVYEPRTYLTSSYQGTLGWGFATALGAKVAAPDRAVLSVSGDGGFLFGATEMATAMQHGINTVNVVFNDDAYGNVRRLQKQRYGGRLIASQLHNPDFVAFARSFGAEAARVGTPEALRDALVDAFAADKPVLIEVPVGEMPVPTWGMTAAWAPKEEEMI